MAIYLQQLYYNIRARRPFSSASEHQRRHPRCPHVLIHTPCPLWLAAKVLGQVGDLTVPDAVRKRVNVNKVLRDQRPVDVWHVVQRIVLAQRQIKNSRWCPVLKRHCITSLGLRRGEVVNEVENDWREGRGPLVYYLQQIGLRPTSSRTHRSEYWGKFTIWK